MRDTVFAGLAVMSKLVSYDTICVLRMMRNLRGFSTYVLRQMVNSLKYRLIV